jgi:uncharacterized protein YbjT (DUF2867 family)
MNVLVAGGHGQIALRLLGLLAERGDVARGLIRNPDHADDLKTVGAQAVVLDLEAETADKLAAAVDGSDAVVFAAGAGPGSGAERKRTVDLGGALKLIEACERTGVRRYLMVSALNVERTDAYPPEMRPYYEAKREADSGLRASGLEHTIVRPGRLTDDPGTGLIEVGMPLDRGGEVPRDDVAATLVAVVDHPQTIGLTFDLLNGRDPIAEAVASLTPEPGG